MRYLLVALVLVLTGCSDTKTAGNYPAGGSGGDNDGCPADTLLDGNGNCSPICVDNTDCGSAAYVCNQNLGLCVLAPVDVTCDPQNCAPGSQCPAPGGGADCEAIPGWCDADGDCPATERCDLAENTCVTRAGGIVATCQQDADCLCDNGFGCGVGLTCVAGVCIGCLDDIQCGTGGTCVLGACITADLGPAGDCINQTCPTGERCILSTGTCEPICSSDAECTVDESCLPLLNYCVAKFGCDTEADCTVVGQQCIGGLCIGCTGDGECKASERCIVGACFPDVGASACDGVTCDVGDSCDPQDGSCYPSDGTCADSSDCRQGQTCNFLSLCSGCSVDGDCRSGQRCLLATCVPL